MAAAVRRLASFQERSLTVNWKASRRVPIRMKEEAD